MRDKVLCRGRAEAETANRKETFFLLEQGYFSVFMSLFAFPPPDSVPVSIQGGVKMSIDEFLSFYDNATWKNQKAQRESLRMVLREELDTVFAAGPLFKGTVLDSGLNSCCGGENYANDSFTVY